MSQLASDHMARGTVQELSEAEIGAVVGAYDSYSDAESAAWGYGDYQGMTDSNNWAYFGGTENVVDVGCETGGTGGPWMVCWAEVSNGSGTTFLSWVLS